MRIDAETPSRPCGGLWQTAAGCDLKCRLYLLVSNVRKQQIGSQERRHRDRGNSQPMRDWKRQRPPFLGGVAERGPRNMETSEFMFPSPGQGREVQRKRFSQENPSGSTTRDYFKLRERFGFLRSVIRYEFQT